MPLYEQLLAFEDYVRRCHLILWHVSCRGADKSLARTGRKQATATILWLLEATPKNFRKLSVEPGLRGSSDLLVERKMATFQLFFSFGSD